MSTLFKLPHIGHGMLVYGEKKISTFQCLFLEKKISNNNNNNNGRV